MTSRRYATPYDFKQALEVHLKRHAKTMNLEIARVRQRFVFERFLARLDAQMGDRVVVKGGVALELLLSWR